MYEKVDTYIYKVGETNFRIKIQKADKKTGIKLNVSQNYKLPIEEVIKIRDKLLNEYEDAVKLKSADLQKLEVESAPIETVKKEKKKKIAKWKKVDKYIYQSDRNKFKILIKRGTKGEPAFFYFSKVITGTIANARHLRDVKLAELKLGEVLTGDKGAIKFEDFIKIFLKEHYATKSPTTKASVVSKLNHHVLPFLGKYKLKQIDALLLTKLLNKVSDSNKYVGGKARVQTNEKISSTTANCVYRVLRNVFNRAIAWGFIRDNPILRVPAPSIDKVKKVIFTLEDFTEVINLIKKEPIEDQCLYAIIICTGFRRGELVALHLDDINFENKELSVNRDIVRDELNHTIIEKKPKTSDSIRDVPIPDFCIQIIRDYLDWRSRKIEGLKLKNPNYEEKENLFLSRNGYLMRPEYPANHWKEFVKKNNLKNVTLHGLRHSYCTLQINENSGLGLNEVQELMGHSQTTTTFHYSHSNKNKIKNAVSVFEKIQDGKSFGLKEVLSVCTGRKYASKTAIMDILDYVVPSSNLSITEKMDKCRDIIYNKYPKLADISDNGININNVFDWLDELEQQYGSSFFIEQSNELEIQSAIEIEKI